MKFEKFDDKKAVLIVMNELEYEGMLQTMEEIGTERKYFNRLEKAIEPLCGIERKYIIRNNKQGDPSPDH